MIMIITALQLFSDPPTVIVDREVIGAGLGATLMISCSVEVIIININMVLKNKGGGS